MFHRTPSGFMLDFPNGWTASVQFGPGNYCTNRDNTRNPFSDHVQFLESNTAEIEAWVTDQRESATTRGWYEFEDGQEVKGWQNVVNVMEFIYMVSAFPLAEGVEEITFPNQVIDLPLTAEDVQVASKKWKPILKDWGIDY